MCDKVMGWEGREILKDRNRDNKIQQQKTFEDRLQLVYTFSPSSYVVVWCMFMKQPLLSLLNVTVLNSNTIYDVSSTNRNTATRKLQRQLLFLPHLHLCTFITDVLHFCISWCMYVCPSWGVSVCTSSNALLLGHLACWHFGVRAMQGEWCWLTAWNLFIIQP